MRYLLITKQEELDFYCSEIAKMPYIAIDTEFMRNKTYYPQLCLLQICYKRGFAIVIDCLEKLDLKNIIDIIYDKQIIKIFHGARQDLEIFYHLRGKIPENIYDTQIAVMALNYPKDLSYEKLIKIFLNKNVNKTQKTSNWFKRPLLDTQVHYAAYDSLYLFDAYEIISSQLNGKHRSDWLHDSFDALKNKELYEFNINKQLCKIVNNSFSDNNVILAKELLLWRERIAKSLNLSRNLVLNTDSIKSIIFNDIKNKEDLLQYIDENIFMLYGEDLFTLLNNATSSNLIESQSYLKPTKMINLNKDQQDLFCLLQIVANIICKEAQVNPFLVFSNNDLTNFICDESLQLIPFLKGWRYEILGKSLQQLLSNKLSLSVNNKQVILNR